MTCGKYYSLVFILTFSFVSLNARNYAPNDVEAEADADSLIYNIRYQLEKQNKTYYKPTPPTGEMREAMEKNRTGLSEEALYLARRKMNPSLYVSRNVTFKDTVIPDPLLMPAVFKKKYLRKEFNFLGEDLLGLETENKYQYQQATPPPFVAEKRKNKIKQESFKQLTLRYPQHFKYTEDDLPEEIIKMEIIQKNPLKDIPKILTQEVPVTESVQGPTKFIPDRLYWTSHAESAIQFAQNYVSPNWHQGGSSNLNIFTKNYLRYNYNKNKVQLTNELEDKISLYNASRDTLHRYKVGEDILRIHSNLGYQAFNNKWFYTLDGEFRTQLLRSYEENQDRQLAGFLSPFHINIGIGMKYELHKDLKGKVKRIDLSVNMAPGSFSYMYSTNKDIDLGRHGFQWNPESERFDHSLSQFGSTLRADMTLTFTQNVTWQSRFYYFTSYDKVISEFENTLTMAINRYFSTRLWLHVRFDDGVTKNEEFKSYFQVNELLSFGFNYKW